MTPAKPVDHAPAGHLGPRPHSAPSATHAPKGPRFAHVLCAPPPPIREAPGLPQAQVPALPSVGHRLVVEPDQHGRRHSHRDDDLDPVARQTAQLAPPLASSPPKEIEEPSALANARVSLEELIPQVVKKIAWSGDAHRGTVRMELGAGELAGATLIVSAEHGRVSVRVDTPPGTDTAAWRGRLASRLEAKGLVLESVDVR